MEMDSKSPEGSGWATFFRFVAIINLLLVVLAVVKGSNQDSIMVAIICGANAIVSFFFAFIIDCVVDIRYYLKEICNK